MSVFDRIEQFWRGADPRYSSSNHSSTVLNGKFDRSSRRCQSSFNIHSHAHQNQSPPNLLFVSKNNSLQRKSSTPSSNQQQQLQLVNNYHPQSGTALILNSPCHVCEENKIAQKPPNGLTKSRLPPLLWKNSSSGVSPNNSNHHHNPNTPNHLFPSTGNDSTTICHGTTKYPGQPQDFRDDLLLESMEDKKSICPDPPVNQPSQYESVKMRLQKPEGRPKSLEYSQRRAWMRLYHNIEVSDAAASSGSTTKLNSPPTTTPVQSPSAKNDKRTMVKPRSKSILHLHRLDSQQDIAQERDRMDTLSNASDDSQCSSLKQSGGSSSGGSGSGSSSGTSLFQRFSKTFSLRFGSGSPSSRKGKKVKYPVGSSPDLYHRVESESVKPTDSGWKWRQSNLNSNRDEKCLSGDSGISILHDEGGHLRSRSTRRTRRIQSENIDAILEAQSSSSSSSSSNVNLHHQSSGNVHFSSSQSQPPPVHMDSPVCRKLSLVEIPDHVWDENNGRAAETHNGLLNRKLSLNSNNNNNNKMTKSYEDLLEAKLDDDGFGSSDESSSNSSNKENLGLTSTNLMTNYSPVHHQSQRNLNRVSGSGDVSGRIQHSRSKSVPRIAKVDFNPNDDSSIRGKVICDILKTENSYVKTLNDICQGFLVPMRKRNDLFNSRIIFNIFSNVEDILRLHARFLEALVSSLNKENLADSSVGHIFTLWTDEFDIYCDYCQNNPISQLTLQNLNTSSSQYTEFFEACRRLQVMDKLPLHGFLLRPIQRIMQYDLQLKTLLKHTESDHKDFESTSEALDGMRRVAQKVNDTQKKFDDLKEIQLLENAIDLFEGPHLVDRNSIILHRGDLIKAHQSRKKKEVHVAILTKELVITRKRTDMNRKSDYLFLCRVDLSHRNWHSIDSNVEDEIFGFVQNSWRIYSKEKSCWILFTTTTATEKGIWLEALEKVIQSSSSGVEEYRVEPKMRERVKELIVEQAQAKLISAQQSQNQTQSSYQNNTLPKSKKAAKLKQQQQMSAGGPISDQMLIEVAKMKRSSFTGNSSSNSTSQKDRTSTFYV